MQTEQRGRTDAVPVPRYKLTRAVILTVLPYRRWVATPLPPKGCWILPPSRGSVVAAGWPTLQHPKGCWAVAPLTRLCRRRWVACPVTLEGMLGY